jgi:hypothetical protein
LSLIVLERSMGRIRLYEAMMEHIPSLLWGIIVEKVVWCKPMWGTK